MNKFDLTNLFQNLRITDKEVIIFTNQHTYFPKEEPFTGWLPRILNIYRKLSNNIISNKIKSIYIVGAGPAVESIAMFKLFEPDLIFLSDIHPDVLKVAEINFNNNCKQNSLKYKCINADLLSYLIENNLKVDLIHENLPNLPIQSDTDIFIGAQTASFYKGTSYNSTPDYAISNKLELRYNLLKQAKNCLNKNGYVISCIGLRIPFPIIQKMYKDLGYSIEILDCYMIEQLAAGPVLKAYCDAQNNFGKWFMFFDYANGIKVIEERVLAYQYNYTKMLESNVLFESAFDAEMAYSKFKNREKIGHIGLIIKANIQN